MELSKTPMVSVIVPVYNVERFLAQCLDSVLGQTFKDFEIVCIDDGSTDASSEILQQYAKRDSRIVAVRQENAGLSAARNAGMRLARGTYIAFLDSDDYLAPDMLEKTVATAEETGAEIVIFDYWLYFDSTGNLGTYRDQEIYARLNGSVFTLEEAPEMAQFIGVWDRLFRRDFIEAHGFTYPVGKIYEDVTFCVESELAAQKIALLSDHLYYYRRDVAGSITGNEAGNRKHKEDFLFVQRYAQERFREHGASEAVWRNYTHYFVEYALMHQRQTRTREFFGYFFDAIRGMMVPDLIPLGQKGSNPEQWFYRMCLKRNKATLCFVGVKCLNQVHKYVGWLKWQMKKRKVSREK